MALTAAADRLQGVSPQMLSRKLLQRSLRTLDSSACSAAPVQCIMSADLGFVHLHDQSMQQAYRRGYAQSSLCQAYAPRDVQVLQRGGGGPASQQRLRQRTAGGLMQDARYAAAIVWDDH